MNAAKQLLIDLQTLDIEARLITCASVDYPKSVVPTYTFSLSLERAVHLHRMIDGDTQLFNYWYLSGIQHPDRISWHLETTHLSRFIKGIIGKRSRPDFDLIYHMVRQAKEESLEDLRAALVAPLSVQ